MSFLYVKLRLEFYSLWNEKNYSYFYNWKRLLYHVSILIRIKSSKNSFLNGFINSLVDFCLIQIFFRIIRENLYVPRYKRPCLRIPVLWLHHMRYWTIHLGRKHSKSQWFQASERKSRPLSVSNILPMVSNGSFWALPNQKSALNKTLNLVLS